MLTQPLILYRTVKLLGTIPQKREYISAYCELLKAFLKGVSHEILTGVERDINR
jgi:hypothetical protein